MDFVDTSAWFAYFLPSDRDHDRVRAYFHSTDNTLVTTDYCVDETLTCLLHHGERRRALAAGRAFFYDCAATIHFLSQQQIERAWLLFQQRAAAGWSFTDCTSKIVIDDLDVATAVSLDAHFHQFGIVVVP